MELTQAATNLWCQLDLIQQYVVEVHVFLTQSKKTLRQDLPQFKKTFWYWYDFTDHYNSMVCASPLAWYPILFPNLKNYFNYFNSFKLLKRKNTPMNILCT